MWEGVPLKLWHWKGERERPRKRHKIRPFCELLSETKPRRKWACLGSGKSGGRTAAEWKVRRKGPVWAEQHVRKLVPEEGALQGFWAPWSSTGSGAHEESGAP